MVQEKYKLGLIGLGVMGRNLVLNMADHGVAVAGYDRDREKINQLNEEGEGKSVYAFESLERFMDALERPKTVMMLVPAGKPVESVIRELTPFLSDNDILIDAGNSHYRDTDRRAGQLAEKKIHYLGVGISGGAYGARYGPSIMPGGPKEAYQHVRDIFAMVAAEVKGLPCVTWLGPGAAGHFVKMVHNGIEYGLMQLIAETYDIMSQGLGLSCEQLSGIYRQWNNGPLNSYLMEITSEIFQKIDAKTHRPLVEIILDEANQKGTGAWSSETALELQVAVPTIDTAVQMRFLSAAKTLRQIESQQLAGPTVAYNGDRDALIQSLEDALLAGFILCYAQGFSLLKTASEAMHYDLQYDDIAALWRGGCIIRSDLLDRIMTAYQNYPQLDHLLEDDELGREAVNLQPGLRTVVQTAVALGIPAPGLMSVVSYYDTLRSPWLPANLIQAQRDYFGSHRYQRVDEQGTFHTQWRA